MNKKYLQSLTRSLKPGAFHCLPKKRSSDTFKKKDKPPATELPNNAPPVRRRSSVTSLTSFKEQPESEESDKEKPVVIVVVVNKRGSAKNVFGKTIHSSQSELPVGNNFGSTKQESCSCPPRGTTPIPSDYVEYFQRLEELICKCAGQKGSGINSQNTCRSGDNCTYSNKSSPIVTQYQQYPMSTRNFEQQNQQSQQCQQQFKQKQQCQSPQQQCQSPQQQFHTPQQQSLRFCPTQEQSQQFYQPQTPHQQSQQCYQPQLYQQRDQQPEQFQQYYPPQIPQQQYQQCYQQQKPQQQSQQCYQPQLYQQRDQQPEQCLNDPQQFQQPQQFQNIIGNDINSTYATTSASCKARSRQSPSGQSDHEYCHFQLPVCVTKSTFQKLQSVGINQTQPLDKCLDTNSQHSNEKYKLSDDDLTNCCDYCTCMEKNTRTRRKRKRKIKSKNMCCMAEKPSNRVILRDIGLPKRCCMSCTYVPYSPCGGTRCCNIGGCCNGMW